MPKQNKKKKNSSKGGSQSAKPVILAEEGQVYGIITKTLGDRHFTVSCQDGKVRRCRVRGKMKNRQWVKDDDVVLVTTRDFDDDEGDIIDIYSAENVKTLKKNGELTLNSSSEEEDREHVIFNFETI